MSANSNLVFDLLNQTKLAKDAQSKIFNLEQIKEIVLHREPRLMPQVLPEMMDFMVEKAVSVRRFLIQFATVACKRDYSVAPSVISLFSFLVADPQDLILRVISIELTKIYDSLVLYIASMPKKTFGSSQNPKDLWAQLRSIVTNLIDTLPGSRDSSMRIPCLQLAECIILFGHPVPSGHNVAEISLHNASIDRNVIIADAEKLLSKLVLWARRGGPQENPFSVAEMIQLSKTLGRIACERPATRSTTVLALTFLLDSTIGDNIELVRTTETVLDSADPPSLLDLENPLLKLKVALQKAKSKVSTSSISVADDEGEGEGDGEPVSKKRPYSSIEGMPGDDVEMDSENWQQSVLEAVDQAQAQASFTQGGPLQSFGKQNASESSVLELATELVPFPQTTCNLRIAAVDDVVTGMGTSAKKNPNTELSVRVHPPSHPEVYADFALDSMKRVIEGLRDVKKKASVHEPASKDLTVRFRICSRLILTLSLAEIHADRPLMQVLVVAQQSIVPTKLSDKIPRVVFLPRPLWVSISSFLMTSTSGTGAGKILPMLDIIFEIIAELYRRGKCPAESPQDEVGGINVTCRLFLYDSLCLAILSRLVQTKDLRPYARDFLMKLPVIPSHCIALLGAVSIYGSQAVSTNLQRSREQSGFSQEERDKGTRAIAMSLLSQVARMKPSLAQAPATEETLSQARVTALRYLLWAAVSEDFGLRSKAVSQLVEDVMPRCDDEARLMMSRYALKSAVSILGPDAVLQTPDLVSSLSNEIKEPEKRDDRDRVDVDPNESHADVETVMEMEMDVDVEGIDRGKGEDTCLSVGVGVEVEVEVEEYAEEAQDGDEELSNNLSLHGVALEFDCSDGFDIPFTTVDAAVQYSEEASMKIRPLRVIPTGLSPEVEANIRRHLHLLCQLSLGKPSLLHSLVDLYIVCTHFVVAQGTSQGVTSSMSAQGTSSEPSSSKSTASEPVSSDDKAIVKGEVKDESLAQIVSRVVQTELLQTLIPALARSVSGARLFCSFSTVLAAARPLVHKGLDLLLSDIHMPPDEDLVREVREFIRRCQKQNKQIKEKNETSISISISIAGTESTQGSESMSEPKLGADLTTQTQSPEPDLEIRFLSLVAGGLSREEVRQLLPRMIREIGSGGLEYQELLRKTFARMVQARPPPLSEAHLLVELHRIDHTAAGMKTKFLLEAIGLCLSNKEVFRSDCVKEAISTLLADEELSFCLMRTVIISAQSYPELKTFGLSEVVPRLVRARTWEKAPRVWEGVAMFVKSFASNRDAEPALRAVLGLPATQLRAILKVAPSSRAALTKLLKTFSEEELVEVVSGRWVGLEPDASASEDAEAAAKVASEKTKLIKELQSAPPAVTK